MLVKSYSSAVFGINATTITIEVNLGIGVNFYLVGLPDNSVKESQQRIKAAFSNNNLKFPGREITVNMAPADIRKEGYKGIIIPKENEAEASVVEGIEVYGVST